MKRLNINIPDEVFEDLKKISKKSGQNMTQVVRDALGLIDIAYREKSAGHKITVSDTTDNVIKEIVI